ncbi:hypothetical protein SOQ14_05270 [Erythrobacter sp. T5W1-R]|jgi:hypothetical protein|uniref:hypothetical protein n=1 Tax=Erythrobacter sp. T5W1-R TaxID=3101752 RepID=UPI002AFEEF20|nr:hypothetical protein [Erythrobacter sp. T5W1-R]MEA1618321.1 hypothetical protein [Erythrobacter sp. T5W1-R]
MAYWDLGMKHIVDVDGQLLAIDADVIDTTRLLEKANRPTDSHLAMVRAGERILLQPRQLIRLPADEVLFFETDENTVHYGEQRLAA